jgi:hypothetical protein
MNLMMQRTLNHRLLILVPGIALLAAPASAQQKIDMRRAATPEMSMRLSGAFGSPAFTSGGTMLDGASVQLSRHVDPHAESDV